MDWLTNLFGGAKDATGDAFNGVTGAATNLANSSAAQKLLDIGAKYVDSSFNSKKAKDDAAQKKKDSAALQAKLQALIVPVGVGLAALLTVGLIVSMVNRSK